MSGRGFGSLAALVDEVEAEAVDLSAEVGEPVDGFLLCAPVEPVLPVVNELLHVGQVRAVVPARARDLVGPAGPRQALAQVVESRLRDFDFERFDAHLRLPPSIIPFIKTCHAYRLLLCRGMAR